ncbi:hypothetical protein LCGC14_0544530, partial [marine sediment metagenome]
SRASNPDGTWDALTGGSNWDVYTKLMLHGDGSDTSQTITDEVSHTVTAVNQAQIDTEFKKFGTGSILFDGTGDYLTVPDSGEWDFGTAKFTIDFWIRLNTTDYMYIIGQYEDGTKYWFLSKDDNGKLNFVALDNGSAISFNLQSTNALLTSTGTWYHVAVVRYGTGQNNMYMFVDGDLKSNNWQVTMEADESMPEVSSLLYIGQRGDNTSYMNGWLEEFRLSKGIARWTANFTSPTSAYSGGAFAITASRFWTMADWQSGRALINSDIGLYTYTGTGDASTVSAAPIGKFLIIWKKYAFIFGIRGSPNNGQYSTISDYTTWPAGNTFSNAFDTSDGDVITGVRILKGKLYIFKRYSIFRITYLGSSPEFQVDQISGVGCPSHYIIKEVDMGGEIGTVLMFLTTDKKLAIFDGYNIQIINDVLTEETNDLFASSDDQPLSFSDMNLRYVDLFHAVVKSDTSEYILYCVLGSDTSVAYGFVFDYRVGGVYPYDGQVFASSCYALSTNKSKKLYCTGYTGYTWLQESGDDDDGTDINAYWVSGKIKAEGVALLNKNLLLGINIKEITSSSTLNIGMEYRFDWNVSWLTSQNFNFDHNDELAFGKIKVFDIGNINNMLQVKLKDNSGNPAPTIYSIELFGDLQPLGVSIQDRATS